MPYPTRSCADIDIYTSVVCHVIQREYRNNMISVDVNADCRVRLFDSKVVTKKPQSSKYMGKVSHYYDVVSIIIIEFIDEQRNDNGPLIFSIKLFGKDGNDMKLYKQLTTVLPHD